MHQSNTDRFSTLHPFAADQPTSKQVILDVFLSEKFPGLLCTYLQLSHTPGSIWKLIYFWTSSIIKRSSYSRCFIPFTDGKLFAVNRGLSASFRAIAEKLEFDLSLVYFSIQFQHLLPNLVTFQLYPKDARQFFI